jgi:hypothetical protein
MVVGWVMFVPLSFIRHRLVRFYFQPLPRQSLSYPQPLPLKQIMSTTPGCQCATNLCNLAYSRDVSTLFLVHSAVHGRSDGYPSFTSVANKLPFEIRIKLMVGPYIQDILLAECSVLRSRVKRSEPTKKDHPSSLLIY